MVFLLRKDHGHWAYLYAVVEYVTDSYVIKLSQSLMKLLLQCHYSNNDKYLLPTCKNFPKAMCYANNEHKYDTYAYPLPMFCVNNIHPMVGKAL